MTTTKTGAHVAMAAGPSPETLVEQYIADLISQSPDPLRELGDYLGRVLDEDEFPTAERYVLAAMKASLAATLDPDTMSNQHNDGPKCYWLCCGSIAFPHNDENCNESRLGHPERVRFGTAKEHSDWQKKTFSGVASESTKTSKAFKIEDGIPLPIKALKGSLQDCMNELQVGQSFLHEKCTLRSGKTYCSAMGKRLSKKFTCAAEGAALRIWRIE